MCFLKSRLFIALLTFVIGLVAVSLWYYVSYQHPIVEIKSNNSEEFETSGYDEVVNASDGSFITTFGWIDPKYLCQDAEENKSGICTTALNRNSSENMIIKVRICDEEHKSNCIDLQNTDFSKSGFSIYDKNSNLIDDNQQIKITSRVEIINGKGRFESPVARIESKEAASLSTVDLRKMNRVESKGRVQDIDLNNLKEIDTLVAHGKESIPFLINKLTDEKRVEEEVIDYWNNVRVGDAAFIILTDFFTDRDGNDSAIEGASFNNFIGCHNREVSSDRCYYSYVKRNGRKNIQMRWRKIWEANKDKIYWNETERNYRISQ